MELLSYFILCLRGICVSLVALRQAPLDLQTQYPDSLLKSAEDDNGLFEDKGQCYGQSGCRYGKKFQTYKWLHRLNQFWETWAALGARPKVLQMLKEGYTQSFQTGPNLTRLFLIPKPNN